MRGMPKRRRLVAVLAALLTATMLVGACTSSKKSAGPLPDAATLLKQSSDTTKKLKSVHLVLSTTGKVPGLPVQTLTGDITTSPSTAASGNAKITVMGSPIEADFVVWDSELYTTALTPGQWSDFGKASDIYDVSTILNPNAGLANVLANFTGAKSEGRDTIGGQNTVRITGQVSADAVNKIAPPLKATQPMPATAWIQETGDHELVQAKLDPTSATSVLMTLSKWNAPVQISKPAVSG